MTKQTAGQGGSCTTDLLKRENDRLGDPQFQRACLAAFKETLIPRIWGADRGGNRCRTELYKWQNFKECQFSNRHIPLRQPQGPAREGGDLDSGEGLSEEIDPDSPEATGPAEVSLFLCWKIEGLPTPACWKMKQVLYKAMLALLGTSSTSSSGHRTDNQGKTSAWTNPGRASHAEERKGP